MTKSIAVGAGLLLTIGTALGGTFIYGQSDVTQTSPRAGTLPQEQVPTPYTIAMWKATAASTDYVSPKVPL